MKICFQNNKLYLMSLTGLSEELSVRYSRCDTLGEALRGFQSTSRHLLGETLGPRRLNALWVLIYI